MTAARIMSCPIVVILFVELLPTTAMSQYEIDWHTIDGGGAMFGTAGPYELSGTIGQPDAGVLQEMNGPYDILGGFWFVDGLCGNGTCLSPEDPCNCATDCGTPLPEVGPRCGDGIDNDCDSLIDCMDPNCAASVPCTCGNGMCVPPENPCNCLADCGPASINEMGLCTDGIDNDCDGPIDCADGDCATDPACLCGNGTCVAPENPCNCAADCGPAVMSEMGRCADGIDNDCDGPIDCQDVDCVNDPACRCGNGLCDLPENSCNCPADCGPMAPETPGPGCSDTVDNDCDGLIDCADPSCAGDPTCVCGDGFCTLGENSCNCPEDCPGIGCEGDVNGDGRIDQIDLLIVGKCAQCDGPQSPACDVNCDGTIDLLDFGDELCLLYSPPAACCPQVHGACIETSLVQSCVLVPAAFCTLIGGTYLGDNVPCPPGGGDCNGNGIGDSCEPQICMSNAECNDNDPCTCDRCFCGVCFYQSVNFGDPNCDCSLPNLDDILSVLADFADGQSVTNPGNDIPLMPPCMVDGIIDLVDILAILNAFSGTNQCTNVCMSGCTRGACCDGSSCSEKSTANCFPDVYKGNGTACPPNVPENPCP